MFRRVDIFPVVMALVFASSCGGSSSTGGFGAAASFGMTASMPIC